MSLGKNTVRMIRSSMRKPFIYRVLYHWSQYLLCKPFVLYSDHEALKFINHQHKLNRRHAMWIEFLHAYSFTIKHKTGVQNVVANVLSRNNALLTSLHIEIIGFDIMKELYCDDEDFRNIWKAYEQRLSKTLSLLIDSFLKVPY